MSAQTRVAACFIFVATSMHNVNVQSCLWRYRHVEPVLRLQNIKLVENVKKLAAKKNATAGQMALAWLHHQVALRAAHASCPGAQCMFCVCAYLHAHMRSEALQRALLGSFWKFKLG